MSEPPRPRAGRGTSWGPLVVIFAGTFVALGLAAVALGLRGGLAS